MNWVLEGVWQKVIIKHVVLELNFYKRNQLRPVEDNDSCGVMSAIDSVHFGAVVTGLVIIYSQLMNKGVLKRDLIVRVVI